jgi:hypothetical protein
MATTPTYSWPIPDDTDLVKDGAEAIRDLGNAIDTTVDGLPGAGLVHIETVTFSAVASVSVDDVFSATYDNYEILINDLTSVSTGNINIRMRASGSDDSTANYEINNLRAGSSVAVDRLDNETSFLNHGISNQTYGNMWVVLQAPFLARITTSFSRQIIGPTTQFQSLRAGNLNTTTSYDGLTFISSGAGNITGSISIYGYAKA